MKKCKILIAYHKPATLIKSEIFEPIQVGRAIENKENKDGKISKRKQEWLNKNLIGDNTGDNISDLNHYFNEMSAIYWAWKNQSELNFPAYIGLMHYRRHFIFSENNTSKFVWLNKSNVFSYEYIDKNYLKLIDEKSLENLLEEYDILASKQYCANNLNDGHYYRNAKERYTEISQTDEKWYELMEKIIIEDFPQYKEELEELEKSPTHYLCNMFVMKKELFDEYCKFTFDVLFKIYEEFKKEKMNIWQTRAIGFLAEFLTSIYISAYKRKNYNKVKELDLTYVENTDIIPFYKKITNFIYSRKRYYTYKRKTILGKNKIKPIAYYNEFNDLKQKNEMILKLLEDNLLNKEK